VNFLDSSRTSRRQLRILSVTFVLVWSSGYVAAGLAVRDIAPLAITFWRFLVAATLLGVVALLRHETWPRGRTLWSAAGVGILLFGVQFGPLYYGIAKGVPAATTALIACSAPLLVAAFSVPLGWERLASQQWIGVGLGVLGVVVTLADRVGRPPQLRDLAWTVVGLLGLVSGTMLQGRARFAAGRAAVASVEIGAGAIVIGILAPGAGSMRVPLTVPALTVMAWIAVVAGAGAPLLMFALLERRGALRTSSLLLVVPGITALASWPILGARVGATAAVGLVIAGIGLSLALRDSSRVSLPILPEEDHPTGPRASSTVS
jgi:drug/metabolite transporter (DMT)-like permease